MVLQIKKGHPALKHGGYAAMSILPGESAADFEKLHKDLIEEHRPDGVTEIHNVAFLAQLLWRRQNLETFRVAEIARRRYTKLMETVPDHTSELWRYERSPRRTRSSNAGRRRSGPERIGRAPTSWQD